MQVQRTLVKSPPEIWTEVSDVEALTRHLGEFGEITITKVEPETKVAWEGEHACGTVELTASGWGTTVVLTAEAVKPEPVPPATPPSPIGGPQPGPPAEAAEPEPVPAATPPSPIGGAQTGPPAEAAAGAPAQPADPRVAPRSRWRRLRFWRRDAVGPTPPTPGPAPGPPAPPAPDPVPPTPTPDPGPPGPPDPRPPQISSDPAETEAVLTRVLDHLGQAHHRPFTR
ncbi:hypothetical protein [Capillimicrobium parvum]|uniref:Uncharacterized protein n=1 Tax=Capillimicrobium parvum TaxID=2884022 RepID=A0A9E6Y234_9ACTN|nr:hypothetical protein [Capillimicrobium parvum]UGS38867.1 hypothetical protein DSM104329_05298 [Capillimicrobium parvum]